MKIDNQDIIRTAQQLRDEENEQLDIRPWNRHRSHFRIPSWLVAIPAAAFIGFILGIWTKSSNQQDTPLTALVDTVYINDAAFLLDEDEKYGGKHPRRTFQNNHYQSSGFSDHLPLVVKWKRR